MMADRRLVSKGLAAIQRRALYPFLRGKSRSDRFDVREWVSHDGLRLEAWMRRTGRRGAPVVVFFMGNVGRLKWFEPRIERVAGLGVDVVAMGYRGGGDLPGRPCEASLKADALAFFDQVGDFLGEEVAAGSGQRYHLLGTSMGTGLAIHVASRRPVASVILEAPFTRIADIVRSRTAGLVDVDASWNTERWDSMADLVDVSAPVLVVHGTLDLVVPFAMGTKVALLAPHPASRFLAVPGASHRTALLRGGLAAMPGWLAEHAQDGALAD